MAVLLVSDHGADLEKWRRGLSRHVPATEVLAWPDVGDPARIDVVLTDTRLNQKGGYHQFSNLRWVNFLGHGVGDVLLDPTLPPHVTVTRLVDPDITHGLAEYVVQAITSIHLRAAEFSAQQRQSIWRRLEVPPARDMRVAILGLGAIGTQIATTLAALRFRVSGWSLSPKTIAGVRCLQGGEALQAMLAESDFVVCVLPETKKTRGMFDDRVLAQMKKGAYLVNVGRGSLIVEDALIAALDRGHLGGASLDVFNVEPLPRESPIWSHPLIRLTPHTGGAGGDGNQFSAVAENYRRFLAGERLLNVVDREKGY